MISCSIIARDVAFNEACSGQATAGCVGGTCAYTARWTVKGDYVLFNVSARISTNTWVAIGFSDDNLMVSIYVSMDYITFINSQILISLLQL